MGYFKFISCLCLTFHSLLESCYDQFIDPQILLPFKVVFQHECHLLNWSVSPLSGHVLEPSLTSIVTYISVPVLV